MKIILSNTFSTQLPADANTTNEPRQVLNACYSYVTPRIPSSPQAVSVTAQVAILLGLTNEDIFSQEFTNVFSGATVITNSQPYAMCYAGHQFGNWAGQLGDGRAINLGEVLHNNLRWAIQLKGAGRTPYSRTADGLAVLRSSIREYLCAEAMHHLGVPTTRSLSLITTGDAMLRDVLYNGNQGYEKGAVVCRVAPSFIRFGNFELFAASHDIATLRQLTNYTITHFYPSIEVGTKQGYLQFFKAVCTATRAMIIEWQRVGFVHGVMNTDNMSILGLTIDYGPYGWLEGYDPNWTPNTTDSQHSRYRYGNQLNVGGWNLVQLANALYPLIEDVAPLQQILDEYTELCHTDYITMMCRKIGLASITANDSLLINELEQVLQLTETDMTIFFRNLSNFKKEQQFEDDNNVLNILLDAFYIPEAITANVQLAWVTWFKNYKVRLQLETMTDAERKVQMDLTNPKYVLRNYMAQLAIDAAEKQDYSIIEELQLLLQKPYSEQPQHQKWFAKRPEWARNKIGCSMLSCSS
jgi:serine/tyrosine/threonine adenylyltransferase